MSIGKNCQQPYSKLKANNTNTLCKKRIRDKKIKGNFVNLQNKIFENMSFSKNCQK